MRLNRKCGNYLNVKLRTTCRAILQYSSSLLLLIAEIEKREEGVVKLVDEEAEEMTDNPAGM